MTAVAAALLPAEKLLAFCCWKDGSSPGLSDVYVAAPRLKGICRAPVPRSEFWRVNTSGLALGRAIACGLSTCLIGTGFTAGMTICGSSMRSVSEACLKEPKRVNELMGPTC